MECMKVEYTHTISVEDYNKLRKSPAGATSFLVLMRGPMRNWERV